MIFFWSAAVCAQVVPGKFIVELDGQPAALVAHVHGLTAARTGVRARQTTLRPRLEALGATITASLDTVANAFIVRMASGDASALAREPGVARVIPVPWMRFQLDHALPLLKVPDAWTAIGGMANAGAGIKIGIIDSGITLGHAAFQDPAMAAPPGFPLSNRFADLAYTNGKVIVARNYDFLTTPEDQFGHGTAVAMCAAGVTNAGPLATITGVAPKAWLGNYKVGEGDTFDGSLLLQALEDAVNDGMDVINISSGFALAPRLAQDPFAGAVEAASSLGVVVVLAAGNQGPAANTITSPATAASAIAVGASENDRALALAGVLLNGVPQWFGEPGSGPAAAGPIGAPVVDVAGLDNSGEACGDLPAGSLSGSIALILRSPQSSGCTFESKLNHAQGAGASAAIVYMNADSPDLVIMDVGAATLPALSVDRPSGLAIQAHLQDSPAPLFTIQFTATAIPANPDAMAVFSSRGPNVDLAIKPDLVATGDYLYTATQSVNSASFLYDASGYLANAAGTSFASPLVAGAVALLKSARAGLTAAQYRSLVVNSATPLTASDGSAFAIQLTGSGLLNVYAALRSTVAVSPVSLSFGASSGTVGQSASLNITNLSATADRLTISVAPATGPPPVLGAGTLDLSPGSSQAVTVQVAGAAQAVGEYQGYFHIHSSQTSVGYGGPLLVRSAGPAAVCDRDPAPPRTRERRAACNRLRFG